ncbi:hypothetical protein HDU67_010353 [Dinochytrium kinnereticum]|nr:hypothetical protein HDU67_010353 [Dinochytrium kinnereticum]
MAGEMDCKDSAAGTTVAIAPSAAEEDNGARIHVKESELGILKKKSLAMEDRIEQLEAVIRRLTVDAAAHQAAHTPTLPSVSTPKTKTPSAISSTFWYILFIPWDVLRTQITKTVKDNKIQKMGREDGDGPYLAASHDGGGID